MKIIALYCALLLTCVDQIICGYDKSVELSKCDLIPLKFSQCENSDAETKIHATLRNINENGDKVLDCEVDMKEAISSENTFTLKIDKWNNGAWQEDMYNADGVLCDYIMKYTPKAWKKVKDNMNPPITEDCAVDVGKYRMDGLQISPDDFDIPVSIYGKMRLELRVFNTEEEEVVCHMMELESDKRP